MPKNIDKDFPCVICGCEAKFHFKSMIESTLDDICVSCTLSAFNTKHPENIRNKILSDAVHNFQGNGLKYLEDKYATKH